MRSRPPRLLAGLAAAISLAIVGSGCVPKPSVRTTPPREAVRGASSLQFVADPANPAKDLPDDVELHPPTPIVELDPPEYPPRALEARAGAATVGLRLIVSAKGRVVDVTPSPLVPSTGGPFEGEFRAAAEAAAAGWLFTPAWVANLEDAPDRDGDGKPDDRVATSIERIPVYLDVRIDFELVEGQGKVRVSGAPEPR